MIYNTTKTLQVGGKYVSNRIIKTVDTPTPSDYAKAVEAIKTYEPNTSFVVEDIRIVRRKVWYKTQYGWINEIILIGAKITKL
jgi:hypothetical protein